MQWLLEISNAIYECIKFAIRDVMVFPGKNLRSATAVCWALFGLTFMCWLFKFPALTDWRGALAASLFMTIIILVKRKGVKQDESNGADESNVISAETDELSVEGTSVDAQDEIIS